MARFEPTSAQKAAIEEDGRAVLVSAAAGSGKTRVLTERLLRRIENDADIDSFLVITFTKAAAAELRSRILDEISERLAADPDNRRLRRQSALCSKAQIGTIDSFCQSFLRENCHAAQLSPEFRVIEEDRAEAIKQRVIQRVLDSRYEEPDEGFRLLSDSICMGQRDDRKLAETVLTLHRRTQSHARPELWLRRQLGALEPAEGDAGSTVWGAEILKGVQDDALYWAQQMDEVCRRAAEDPVLSVKYGPSFGETALSLREFTRACSLGWDRARQALPISYPKLGRVVNPPDEALRKSTKAVRELCKKSSDKYVKLLSSDSEGLLDDMRRTAPAMRALIELTLRFDKAYAAEKRRRAEVDFADLEHLTAQLLTNEDGSPTQLARDTSQRFCEIMVDEYQDVNRVQDDIFRALSKNGENLFMVGDVKQSIYRFRLADPLIFTEKYESYAFLSDAKDGEPVKIMLQENFRSRQEVIDGINGVFSACMSKKLGDVDYDKNARLRCGGVYGDEGVSPELVLIDAKNEDDLRDKSEKEAAYVAERILGLMRSGMTVSGRALGYGDIALLMRSANSVGEVYRRELILRGIPVAAGQGGSFFASTEIASLMSLLAVIDNPHQDVALIAVLRSSAFGFSADELTEIRLCDRDGDFYTALKKAAGENEKCARFLETLGRLRTRASDTPVDELLLFIYNELELTALCAAMQDAPQRCANLRMMLELSKRFAAGGFHGLHRFCRWLRQLAERGGDTGAASSEGAVKIMTVHKSKGLEFPVVFLCDTSHQFNSSDLKATVLIHPELGLGPKVCDLRRRLEYPCLARLAIKQRLKRELLSEEMRLLYVALTRAKERLIVTAAVKEPQKRLDTLEMQCTRPMSPEVLMSAQSMSDWMIYAYLCTGGDKLRLTTVSADEAAAVQRQEIELEKPRADAQAVEKLRRNLAFSYPHEAAAHLPSKLTATELKHLEEPDGEAASLAPGPRPSFRTPKLGREQSLSPTQRGSAAHALLQHIDYGKTGSEEEIQGELRRLVSERFLSARQAEAVDTQCILRLFASPLGQRIMAADELRREFKFSLLCPAESFFSGGEGESVLLQGVIDCMIVEHGEITIIDYKTDRVSGEETLERAKSYESQLRAYAWAAERMTGKPVRECVLYFLHSGESVKCRLSQNPCC